MEPLKRKIMFDRKSGKVDVPPEKVSNEQYLFDEASQIPAQDSVIGSIKKVIETAEKVVHKKIDTRTRSEKIIEWFGSHELISVNGVCQQAQIDTSNFNKLLKAGREIPDKILDKIEPIIKLYGYE